MQGLNGRYRIRTCNLMGVFKLKNPKVYIINPVTQYNSSQIMKN